MTTDSVAKQRGWTLLEEGLSNFDGIVPAGLEEKLRKGGCYCNYAAWNFHAQVWHENRQFFAHINQYGMHSDTLTANSVVELMKACSDMYGQK